MSGVGSPVRRAEFKFPPIAPPPSQAEQDAALAAVFGSLREQEDWLKARAEGWREALALVGKVGFGDTGQSAICRAFLWSVWRWKGEPDPISGRRWSPIELRGLDGKLVRAIAAIEAWVCLPEWSDKELAPWVVAMQEAAMAKPKGEHSDA